MSPWQAAVMPACPQATPQRGGALFCFISFSSPRQGDGGSCLQKQTLPSPQAATLWDRSYRAGLGELLPWKSPRLGG